MAEKYRIGPFLLDAEAQALTQGGNPVNLGQRAVAVLSVLVRAARDYVPKMRIMDAAWPGMVVEESNLSVQISAIRRALAQAPGGDRWLETLARRGYRFVGPVTVVPPGGTPSYRPHSNLPEPLTSFVGREKELAKIRNLLSSHRLVTLTGAGGVGKTRIALRVASQVLDACADGVWLVELAALWDADLVPQVVGGVLGLPEQPGKSVTQTLTEYLQSRRLLLVIDNAEHLIRACAQFVDAVMQQCPQVEILVTSRERLGVPGEVTYRVPSLSMPNPRCDITSEGRSRYDSVQLFVDRAQLLRPQFAVTDQNAPTLACICNRLDGIPLAIELAAARVRSMSLEELNQRLDQRFRLLTGGSRTAPRRQQTLRAVIDWSYDLLDGAETTLLCRLSVFSGSWTLEAAEHVCSGDGVDAWEMLDLVTTLTDKSLVMVEDCDGATRYRLLETLREYVWERLMENADANRWRDRHLAYFVKFVDDAELHLRGPEQHRWLDRLEAEHDNIRSALTWSCAEGGDSAGGLRLVSAFWPFWLMRNHFREGSGWLSRLVAAVSGEVDLRARARALRGSGVFGELHGDYPAADAFYKESIAICRELGDRRGIAACLNNMGSVASAQGDDSAARVLWEESLGIRRELRDALGIADLLGNLGKVAYHLSDYASARTMWEESLVISRELGDRRGISFSLSNLGRLALAEDDHASSRAMWEESREITRELGDRWGLAWELMNLGDLAFAQNDHAAARTLHQDSLLIRSELGNRPSIADSLDRLASVTFFLSGPLPAARIWGAVERLREELGVPLSADERLQYDRLVSSARVASDHESAFQSAWQQGRAMTLEQAVAYALANVKDEGERPSAITGQT